MSATMSLSLWEGVVSMIKKVLALAAVLLVAMVGTAQAQAYPPEGNTITSSDTSVAPGGTMVLGIQICRPSSTATFQLDSAALATATANSSGVASTSVTIPSSTSVGSHTIQGACTGANGQPLTLVLGITITGAGAATTPVTGASNTVPMTQIALGAIAAGGLLVLVAKKRSSSKADTRETAGV